MKVKGKRIMIANSLALNLFVCSSLISLARTVQSRCSFFLHQSVSSKRITTKSMGGKFSNVLQKNTTPIPQAIHTTMGLETVSSPQSTNVRDHQDHTFAYGYCHGFLSSMNSFKGTFLQKVFKDKMDQQLDLLDLNQGPDASTLTYSGALQAVEMYYNQIKESEKGEVKLRLIGSSLGGYIAARFAELHPEKVDCIFLLCPGFNLGERWPKLFGEKALSEWENTGSRTFTQQDGQQIEIPYRFIEDGFTQPAFPKFKCPCIIIHGIHDEIVPIEASRKVAENDFLSQRTTLYFVDDDHALTSESTLKLTSELAQEFFGLPTSTSQNEEKEIVLELGPQTIEVEKKYVSTDPVQLESLLSSYLVAEIYFTDAYWDTPGSILMKNDYWLRNRSGVWELKYPVKSNLSNELKKDSSATFYAECCGENNIKALLINKFPKTFKNSSKRLSFEKWLKYLNLEVFSEFQTCRKKYKMDDGCSVDIDRASFGFEIIEVERTCNETSKVDENLKIIKALASKLSLNESITKAGKLENYIMQFCPEKKKVLEERGCR